MNVPQVKEHLRGRYASAFALPIATLEQLRSDTLLSIETRQESNSSSTYTVELPFTVEQLQQRLEAFMQSLSDDLTALFGSIPSSSSAAASSSPAASTSTADSVAATTLSTAESWAEIPAGPPGSFSTVLSSPPPVLPTIFTTTLSTVTRTLTVQYSNFITSALPGSTPAALSSNRSEPYVFDPMANDNVVVYYGQTTQTSSVPLKQVCTDPNVDVVILAFVPTFFGPGGWPTLNMGPHCWAANAAQTQAGATGLIDCVSDGFAEQVQQCQDIGKKVMLSLGGAQGYSDTTIPSDQDAEMLASNLWNLFLGGTEIPQTNAIRPFGDVVLDGIDIGEQCTSSGLHPPSHDIPSIHMTLSQLTHVRFQTTNRAQQCTSRPWSPPSGLCFSPPQPRNPTSSPRHPNVHVPTPLFPCLPCKPASTLSGYNSTITPPAASHLGLPSLTPCPRGRATLPPMRPVS
jgi:Glycosyl hydrolases family 18